MLELSLIPPSKTAAGRFQVNGSTKRFTPLGRAVFKPPGVPLHALSQYDRGYSIRCVFSSKRFEELRLHAGDWDPGELTGSLDVHDKPITALLMRLAQEARAPGFASQILVEGCTTSLMVELIRYLRGAPQLASRTTGGLSPQQLKRVQECIGDAEGAMPTADQLAQVAGVSCRHLMRAFKQSTGRTVGAFMAEIQLNKAKILLAESDLAIKQIASRLGFAHARNFSATFYRATLQSPNAFRQEHRTRK